MDETFVIVGADGTEHEFPVGLDPQKAAAIVRGQGEPVRPPDPRVVAEQNRLTAPGPVRQFAQDVLTSGVNHAADTSERAALGMGLGLLGKAAPYVPGIVQKAGKALSNPLVGSAIGAAEGARHGGMTGALAGGITGYGGSKAVNMLAGKLGAPNVAAGMSRAGQAVPAATGQPMLDALMRGASYDELAALNAGRAAAPAAKAAAPVAKAAQTSLVDEVAARQKLANPIDWRTTDVTPLKKPGKGIHFGEESTPGLLKMLQDAQLAKDATLADKIKKAISQRSHITGKVGS